MKKRRISGIAGAFLKSADSSTAAAVEFFNRPGSESKYQLTGNLLLNSWNLSLKAFNHKQNQQSETTETTDNLQSIQNLYLQHKSELPNNFPVSVASILLIIKFNNFPFSAYTDFSHALGFSILSVNLSLLLLFQEEQLNHKPAHSQALKFSPNSLPENADILQLFGNSKLLQSLSKSNLDLFQNVVNASASLYNNNIQQSILANYPNSIHKPELINNSEIITAANETDGILTTNKQQVFFSTENINQNNWVYKKVYTESEADLIGYVNEISSRTSQGKSFKKALRMLKKKPEIHWEEHTEKDKKSWFMPDVYQLVRKELEQQKKKMNKPEVVQRTIFDAM